MARANPGPQRRHRGQLWPASAIAASHAFSAGNSAPELRFELHKRLPGFSSRKPCLAGDCQAPQPPAEASGGRASSLVAVRAACGPERLRLWPGSRPGTLMRKAAGLMRAARCGCCCCCFGPRGLAALKSPVHGRGAHRPTCPGGDSETGSSHERQGQRAGQPRTSDRQPEPSASPEASPAAPGRLEFGSALVKPLSVLFAAGRGTSVSAGLE